MEDVVVANGRQRITRRMLAAVLGIAVAALLLFGAGYLTGHSAPTTHAGALERDNAALKDELGKARLDLELELATRSEVERQLAETKERLRQTEQELAFIRAAGGQKPQE